MASKNIYDTDYDEFETKTTEVIETQDLITASNVKLTREERETLISYSDMDGVWTVDTTVTKHMNKLEKQGWTCTGTQYYPDGTVMAKQYIGNKNSISIRNIDINKPKRVMSEEHKLKLQQARFNKG